MSDDDGFYMDFDPDDEFWFNGPKNPLIDPPLVRAYLASPLTNLDEVTRAESAIIRKEIRRLFSSYDFQGVRFEVYDPAEITPPGTSHTAEEVYVTDHHQTSQSDFVIFYVLAASLGVGMEAQIAADCTLPKVVVARKGASVSRMFQGLFSPTVAWIDYEDAADAGQQMRDQLPSIAHRVVESARQRRTHIAAFSAEPIGAQILKLRLIQGISIHRLASETDVAESWLKRLEWDPCLAGSVTLIQFHRVAIALQAKASLSTTGVPTLQSEHLCKNLATAQSESLNNLITFVQQQNESTDDDLLLAIWAEYMGECERLGLGGAGDGNNSELAVCDWQQRYCDEHRKSADMIVPMNGEREESIQEPAGSEIRSRQATKRAQPLLPGIEPVQRRDEVLRILGVAKYGLPPFVLASTLRSSAEELEVELQSDFESGSLISQNGTWTATNGKAIAGPLIDSDVWPACLTAILDDFEFDADAFFSKQVLRNASLLANECNPLTPVLGARLSLWKKHLQEAHKIARENLRSFEASSREHVELLIILGRCSPTDASCFDDAIGTCSRHLNSQSEKDRLWTGLLARATCARGMARMRNEPRNAQTDLAMAAKLWKAVGNHVAASFAQLQHLLVEKKLPLNKVQQVRFDQESPAVRLNVLRGYEPASDVTSVVRSFRKELTDSELEHQIQQAKVKSE